MAERREKKTPIIHNPFPVSKSVAFGAAAAMCSYCSEVGSVEGLSKFAENLKKENPELGGFLWAQIVTGLDPHQTVAFLIGSIYVYESLRLEARHRGGCLPVITHQEIERYISDHTSKGEIPFRQRQRQTLTPELGAYLDGKVNEFQTAEPNLAQGFTVLTKLMTGLDQEQISLAERSTFQIYAIFKTHSEIQKIREIAK